jgi:hypothetical protein
LPNTQLSRVHRVTVRAKETAQLTIDAGLDLVVQTSKTWTGLAFTSAAQREKSEIEAASQFAAAVDAKAVAVVGIDQVRGKPAIVGFLVNRTRGAEIRRASVALEPTPSAERLEALASFLVGEISAPDGIEVAVIDRPGTGGGSAPVERGWGGWKWLAGGLAIATFGTGGVLLGLDGSCRSDPPAGVVCPDVYNTATPAYLTLGGGAVLAGITMYLFVRGPKSKPRSAMIVPMHDGAFATFSTRF